MDEKSNRENMGTRDGNNYKDCIKILFAGDLCPINSTIKAILEERSNDIVAPLGSAFFNRDLAVVNLEGSLKDEEGPIKKTGPNLKIDPACIDFIEAAGFDAVTLANNHTGDFGPGSLLETMKLLDLNGILHVGAGKNLNDSSKPLYLEKKGIKVALLSYAEYEFGMAGKDIPGASPLDPLANIQDIKRASSRADVTVVVIHGGNEHCPIPNPSTVKAYRAFAEAGASAVIGMHPHCPQGMEIYNGVPIVYSLGNFLFDYPHPQGRPDKDNFWWKGYMVKITLSKVPAASAEKNEFSSSMEIVPYTFWPDGTSIKPLTGEEREGFFNYFKHISDIIGNESELNKLWDAWCLINGPWWIERFKKARYPVNDEDTDAYGAILGIRNGFTCAAHYEVIKNFMRMICEGRTEPAAKYVDRVKALMKGII